MPNFIRTIFFKKKLTFFDKIITFLKGILMGIVELIPGVGMATLSLNFGIYHSYITFLHNVSVVFKESALSLIGKGNKKKLTKTLNEMDSTFGFILFFGIIVGIILFSKVLSFTINNFPAYTNALFFGLVLASVFLPFKQLKNVTFANKLTTLVTFAIFFYVFGLHQTSVFYVPSLWLLFIAGFFSVVTLVLPGLGGFFILLILGVYEYVIHALQSLSISGISSNVLLSLGILLFGFLLGFNILIGLLKTVIKKHKPFFMSFLSGIMFASLRVLYPFVTLQGDTKLVTSASNLTSVQLIIIFIIVVLSFMFTKLLNSNIKTKDPIEDL